MIQRLYIPKLTKVQVKKFAASKLDVEEIYPVHRLDKMTSGLIVFAKNINTARAFQLMFEQHQVEKCRHPHLNIGGKF